MKNLIMQNDLKKGTSLSQRSSPDTRYKGNRNLVVTNPILAPNSAQSSAIKTDRKNMRSVEVADELFPNTVKKVGVKVPDRPCGRGFIPG